MAQHDSQGLEDQREVELGSLAAIFPEIQVHGDDPHSISLEVTVNPVREVVVVFPAPSEGLQQQQPPGSSAQRGEARRIDSHELSYLPSLSLQLSLPPGYPATEPPKATISTSPSWLPAETIHRLEDDCSRLWEELGHDLVAYAYIDHVQQAADDVFGMLDSDGALELNSQFQIALLDYDIRARRAAFEKGTFDCGVCLEPKKGSVCHRMLDCGHVFCRACLQDFYNEAIKQGDLATVRCLEPNCAAEREKKALAVSASKRRRRPKAQISPGELLQIPLERDVVQRYVNLKYKTELESDRDTVYCPRSWCSGAARSKKHKKPEGLELVEVEEADDEGGTQQTRDDKGQGKPADYRVNMADMLAICEDCGFAFCSRCSQSWHGEFYLCMAAAERRAELSAEEKASLDYLALHSTPCPTCLAPAQKTMGCNHMTCFRCQTHFCYLCSAWLNPYNPYEHFNRAPGGRRTACYNRLWELEEGDGDHVGDAVEGDPQRRQPAAWDEQRPRQEDEPLEIEQGDADGHVNGVAVEGVEEGLEEGADPNHGRVEVAREGPLVLRIEANVPPAGHRGRGGARGAQRRQAGRGGEHNAMPDNNQHQAQPQRGRGRGGGRPARAGRARAAAARRQNNNAAGRGGREGEAVVAAQGQDNDFVDLEQEGLNDAQQAWIRRFVQLALEDEEDLADWDGDEDGRDDFHLVLFE